MLHDILRYEYAHDMMQILDIATLYILIYQFKPLNKTLGLPPKPSILEAPKL